MSSLNINSLYQKMNENNIKRYKVFDDILKKLHHKIKYHANLEKTFCFFKIPGFIIGVPLYDIDDLKNYILKSLDNDGFKYIYIEPNWLFISWEIKNKKKIQKPKAKKTKEDYKLIDEYKPSGNFIYNNFDITSMKEKMDHIKKF
tara:strand:- start:1529 stop:1963 length:435 start_codon:yes stop_codon:yes gene_type:complete